MLYLLLRSVSMDDIDVDSVIGKLVKEILRSVLGLNKYQHRRLEALHRAEHIKTMHVAHHCSFCNKNQ